MDASLWTLAKAGDSASRNSIIEAHAGMAARIARRARPPMGSYVDPEDLESAAVVGLIDAVDRFQPERGVPFEAYAVLRIKGAIIDELRRAGDRARGSDEQVQPKLSLEQLLADDQVALAAPDDLEARHEDEDLRMKVVDAMRELSPRQRELLGHYYTDGLNLRQTGERMGVSEARVCQLHGKAIEALRESLGMPASPTVDSAIAAA